MSFLHNVISCKHYNMFYSEGKCLLIIHPTCSYFFRAKKQFDFNQTKFCSRIVVQYKLECIINQWNLTSLRTTLKGSGSHLQSQKCETG